MLGDLHHNGLTHLYHSQESPKRFQLVCPVASVGTQDAMFYCKKLRPLLQSFQPVPTETISALNWLRQENCTMCPPTDQWYVHFVHMIPNQRKSLVFSHPTYTITDPCLSHGFHWLIQITKLEQTQLHIPESALLAVDDLEEPEIINKESNVQLGGSTECKWGNSSIATMKWRKE